MIVIALAMIYCDPAKFWEYFYVDRRRFFFVSARKIRAVLFLWRGRGIINGVLERDFLSTETEKT